MIYSKECSNPKNNPNCKKIMVYSQSHHLIYSKKKNLLCSSCSKYKYTPEIKNMWIRQCRDCNKAIKYKWLRGFERANREKRLCKSCCRKGKKSPMYGVRKFGKENPFFGKTHSLNTKKKLREANLRVIKEHSDKGGQIHPNYNPYACQIIEEYGKKNGYNFQHAENGGEICIDGYFPDGMDERRKTIIEVDEKYHFRTDKKIKKDMERQKYLERLGYKIIRIKI